MAKNPKSAIKKTFREFDKLEKQIDTHDQPSINHPAQQHYIELMKEWHNSFKKEGG